MRNHHLTIHEALQSAVKWGILSRNPADGVQLPRVERREMHILNEGDIAKLLEVAKATPYYSLFYIALYTGMRRSELLGLRWVDVDLDLSQLSVTRTLHRLRNGTIVFQQPKTAKSRRMIALPPSATLVLREHYVKQEAGRILLNIPFPPEDLVFSQSDGKPLQPDTVTHAWIKLARSAGLRGVRLHDSRHSHATIMLKAGIHPKVVQERLGHSSIQTTIDTYSHVLPGLQEAAAQRFDEGLRRHTPNVKNRVLSEKE